ncbi:MAG: hypothetical protein GXO66_02615 [Euryarchaeota archaeon]|nr:hypothetical protein [Euryarchaeota archaeon]
MIRAEFMIESQSNSREAAVAALRELEEKLRAEQGVNVLRVEHGDALEQEGLYSCITQLELEFADLRSYLKAAIAYGPSAIYVLSPEKLVLSTKEFLLTLGEVIRVLREFYSRYRVGFELEPEERVRIGIDEYDAEELMKGGALHVKLVAEVSASSEEEAVRLFVGDIGDEAPVMKAKSTFNRESGAYLVAVEAFPLDARALFSIAVRHVPVLVEVLEPEQVTLSIVDLQDMGLDLAGVFFEASQMLALG